MGVLLIERNGHRVIWVPREQSLLFEYKTKDALGADRWDLARRLEYMTTGPGGRRPNTLFTFIVEMFKSVSDIGNQPVTETNYSRTLEEL